MSAYKLLILSFLIFVAYELMGQRTLTILPTDTPIQVDGKLTEAAWDDLPLADTFFMNFPQDSVMAFSQTTVRMTYDDQNLYIGAICYDLIGEQYVIQTLKRDFDFETNDAFAVYFNPFCDGRTGWSFAVNPAGIQREGMIPDGGRKGIDVSWDGPWESEVSQYTNRWEVEMKIPLKTLRYDSNIETWCINFARQDLKRNETSVWNIVPRDFDPADLSFTGKVRWAAAPKKQGSNITVIPYAAGLAQRNYENPGDSLQLSGTGGLDVRIGLTSSLQLDLTINPDFSQVEVDEQVINLSRFELEFPERRWFFLENKDIFSKLGTGRIRPFFSRRIGGVGNTPVPILFGAKLSGKINSDWRIGLMNVQTEGVTKEDEKSKNYSIVSVQRNLFKQSNVSAFITNRQSFTKFSPEKEDYDRTGGVEFDFRSRKGNINSTAYGYYSLNPEKLKDNYAYGGQIRYSSDVLNGFVSAGYTGENYINSLSFVPYLFHEDSRVDTTYRKSYFQIFSTGSYLYHFDKREKLDFAGLYFRSNIYFNEDGSYREHDFKTGIEFRTVNGFKADVFYKNFNTFLFYPFSFRGFPNLIDPGEYPGNRFGGSVKTGERFRVYGEAGFEHGNVFMGQETDYFAGINFRAQPWGLFGVTYTQKRLDFPEPFTSAEFHLVGSKIELSFNRNLFFTTFLQYNTQKNNFNINSRIQWRYKPMSDIYIVYTDNYTTDNMAVKNRALVVKISYWLNL